MIIKKIKDLKKKLYIISPVNRLIEKESPFIEIMKKGDWVLIDEIEFALSYFLEKFQPYVEKKKNMNFLNLEKNILYGDKNIN